MKPIIHPSSESKRKVALTIFGSLIFSAVFAYFLRIDSGVGTTIKSSDIWVFMIEAFFLMILFTWLIGRAPGLKSEPENFVVLSLNWLPD